MRRSLVMAAAMIITGSALGQDQLAIPDDLSRLIGKNVLVGRLPLCEPKTFVVNMTYAGKQATVISFVKAAVAQVPPNVANQMAPSLLALMEDSRKGGVLLFQFEGGMKLDTCVAQGLKQIADNLELVAGQTMTPEPIKQSIASSVNATASQPNAASTPPQECPLVVTKITSGDGGLRNAFAEALTTSEFQRQLDETMHDGKKKHFLGVRIRNNSQKRVLAFESVVVYSNKMGDETLRNTLMSQNTKPLAPGQDYKSYAMDREEYTQTGAGQVSLHISRVRFDDNTFWLDNGSHSCSLSININ